jgi:mannosyltransferase
MERHKQQSRPAEDVLARYAYSLETGFQNRSAAALLSFITLLAAVIRVLYVSSKSLSLDEGFSVYMSHTSSAGFWSIIWNGELNMALYYALLRVWLHVGTTEFVIRLLSVLFGILTIPVVYFLALRLFGRIQAAGAALLLALHPFHVALSQTARGYSLVVLLISLSSLFFLRTLASPNALNGSVYALLSALAIYSQFFASLVILAQLLSLLVLRQRRHPWPTLLRSIALLIVLLLPIVVFLLRGVHSQLGWVEPLSSEQVVSVFYALTLPKNRSLVYLVLWIGAIGAAIRQSTLVASPWPTWFCASWIAVPFAFTASLSLLRPAMVPRFLAVLIPAAVLLAAAGLAFYRQRFPLIMVLILAIAVLFSVKSIRFYFRHSDLNEDWRGATEYIFANVGAGDDVIVLPPYARFTFDYYRQHASSTSPPFFVKSALTQAYMTPQPRHIWIIISGFVKDHIQSGASSLEGYCQESEHEFAGVKVQRLRRCDD